MKKITIALLLALFLVMPFQAKAQTIDNEQVIIYLKAQISIILQLIQLLQQQLAIMQAQEAQQVQGLAEPPPIVQSEPIQQLITQSQTMPAPESIPTPQGLTPEEKEKLKKEKTEKEAIFKEVTPAQINGCKLARRKEMSDLGVYTYWPGLGKSQFEALPEEKIEELLNGLSKSIYNQDLYLECITPESTRQKTPEQLQARNRIAEIDRLLEK